MTPEERKHRNVRRNLEDLVATVTKFLAAIDAEMKLPSSTERGQRIARLCNALEAAKDGARFNGLDFDFRTGKKRKPAVAAKPRPRATPKREVAVTEGVQESSRGGSVEP